MNKGNNFDHGNLRAVAASLPPPQLPDLAAIAQQAAMRAAQHPWANLPTIVSLIPDSCLYQIYSAESIDAVNQGVNMINSIAAGQTPVGPSGRPIPTDIAVALAEASIAMGQQKATLAAAAATMARLDFARGKETPTWFGPDGKRETGYAAIYFEDQLARRTEQAADDLAADESAK